MNAQRSRWWCSFLLPGALLLAMPAMRAQVAPGAGDAAIQRDFQAAMSAEDRGDLDQAKAILGRLHKEHPGRFEIDESLGLLLASSGDMGNGLPLLEAAVKERPSSDAAHANLGAAYYHEQQSGAAMKEFQRAVQLNPANASAQRSLGSLLMENHKPVEAAKALVAAQRLKPEDADLKLDCAAALLEARQLEEARRMLESVPHADQSARAQSLLGEADEKAGKYDQAIGHFSLAAKLEPSEENAWQLASELLRHWAFDAAATEFQAASGMFPQSERMQLGLGAALFGEEKYAKAIPVFAGLVQRNPGSPEYAALLGITCDVPLNTETQQCATLVKYAQDHPADAVAATYTATYLVESEGAGKNLDLREKLLKQAVTADPKLPEAQFQMGALLQDLQKWPDSIPYLERAVALKPDDAVARYHLARAYWRVGRKQDGDAQMVLQKKYAAEAHDDLDRRLTAITRFVVEVHP